MKFFAFTISLVVLCSVCGRASAQSGWNWKRLNWFNKEQQEVEPVELTDEPAKPRWQNPFGEMSLRPRPIEWRTPAFMRRMNENSTRMWKSTRRSLGHWASSTGTAIRNSTYETWDAITRAASPKSATDGDKSARPAPNFGGVNEFLARPKLKF